MNTYKELRKRYNRPVLVMLIIIALPFLYAVQVTQSKKIAVISFLIYLLIELILLFIKEILFDKKMYSLIYKDINLDLMLSYMMNQKGKKFKTIKMRVLVATLYYYYMIGDFTSIKSVVNELKKNQQFTKAEQVKLNEFLLNVSLFSNPNLEEDEFEKLLSKYLLDYESTKKAYRARYDILVKKETNDAILNEVTNLKFFQLESTYLKALNEFLKGNRTGAMELFRIIVKEDERLYLVKMARSYLDSENLGKKSVSPNLKQ